MDTDYYGIILLTFVAFIGLAALLLVPIYRFLKREDEVNKRWTDKPED